MIVLRSGPLGQNKTCRQFKSHVTNAQTTTTVATHTKVYLCR